MSRPLTLMIMFSCLLLGACAPTPGQPAANSGASSANADQATAKVLVSKQAYLDFLACAQAAEASAQHKATIEAGIKNVKALPDESFTALKANLAISASDFVARYGSCVK